MNQSKFIEQVRQYASISRRTGQSFAAQVNTLANLRYDTMAKESNSPSDFVSAQEEMRDFLEREYAAVDRDFTLDIIPF